MVLNCTLKPSPQESNTELLAGVVVDEFRCLGVDVDHVRVVDRHISPGVETNLGPGDEWPRLHDQILAAPILVLASPTWLAPPSSVAQRVLERMDAMPSETDDGRPVAYNKVAGVVVTGNEDGAHHAPAAPWHETCTPSPRHSTTDRCWHPRRNRHAHRGVEEYPCESSTTWKSLRTWCPPSGPACSSASPTDQSTISTGRAWTTRATCPLPWLSANKLDPPDWWTRPLLDWLARQVCQYLHLAKRSDSYQGWVLTGTMVGRGPDDEPLLGNVEPLAWLGEPLLAEAQARYDERFHRSGEQGKSGGCPAAPAAYRQRRALPRLESE